MEQTCLMLHFNMDLHLFKFPDYYLHTIYINHINTQCNDKSVLDLLYCFIYICHIRHHFSKIQASLCIFSKDDLQYIYIKKILFLIINQQNNPNKDYIYNKNNGTKMIHCINWLSYINHIMEYLSILLFCSVVL